jgi:thiamine-monophosphate kinase
MTGDEARRVRGVIDILRACPAKPRAGFDATVGVSELDDCAVIPITPDLDLVIGSDFVRGEGFRLYKLGLLSPFDVGYYLIGANASDLAAMGAKPIGVTVVYRYADNSTDAHFNEIMSGVARACQDFEMPLLGGDSGTYESPVLAASAFGTCPHGRALLRSRGRPGDALILSGTIGVAGAAFAYFGSDALKDNPISEASTCELLRPWRRVSPALDQGQSLVELRLSTCGIDTSDGLKTACNQLAAASGVDVVLCLDALPIPDCVYEVARVLNSDPISLACGDSVDFRLLFTVEKSRVGEVRALFTKNNWPMYEIGELTEPSEQPSAYLRTVDTLIEIPGREK